MAKIAGKPLEEWIQTYPLLESIIKTKEVFWVNPVYQPENKTQKCLSGKDIDEAEARLLRFAPYIAKVFPETGCSQGIIESPLVNINGMQQKFTKLTGAAIPGNLYLKCDSHLPISGSVKARGGIYEVLKVAETIAIRAGILSVTDDYSILATQKAKELFSNYAIAVGSTGNLGLSIGIMSAALGFKVTVHMSADAKQWKKDLLREKGAVVVEHTADYSKAVEAGRVEAQLDPNCHFVDDENSQNLFLGYAVAAKRLKEQLEQACVTVDENHPLFVYLPCGVGGGPGGITFGLKTVFQDKVHCFFAEPTHSPAMLLGLLTGMHDKVSAQEFGIDNKTDADGLAVGRPSGFVGKFLENDISGVFTVQDEELYRMLALLADSEKIELEPSALAGLGGPARLLRGETGRSYLQYHGLDPKINNITHIAWATGGSMVPPAMMQQFYHKGKQLLSSV